MGARVTITFEGLETVLNNLTTIEEKAGENLVKQTKALSDDAKQVWKQGTPEGKTKRLRSEETSEPSGLSITFRSPTRYYVFVEKVHDTPRGWRTKRGYRLAKHRSHVAGREMTAKLVDFLKANTREYLSKFLDGV